MREQERRQLRLPESFDSHQRREWLKYQLKTRGFSLAQLARDHGVTRQTMAAAIVSPNRRCEQIIANALGLTPESIWPERYHSKGSKSENES